ncbi:ArnT family glycosyltransferase [Alicycliphilus denitrificans]|uniref:ArnT family glycosyltransferase n=1 Tax=Alicycliphilus denitrificans TaxID=179636 RepID=UPI003A80E8BA
MNVSTAPGALAPRQPLAHPLLWLMAIALAHVAVRVAVSPALKWDEAEQLLWSQELALGYGAQPPLYTWLQWLVNQVFGPSVLALAALKHTLLALTYALMYLAGRELLDGRGAWWASASMLLLPPLGWFSVRDHTHTILVTAMTCGAWWLLLRIARRPRPLEFALLGLVCGLGMLSKYSFALAAGAMLLAALSVTETRRALLSRGWWWAPVAGLLVVLPHATWLAAHLAEATAGTIGKMEIQPENGLGKGLLSLLGGVAGTLALWALFALWAFRAAWWRTPWAPAAPWAQRVFVRYVLLIMLALLGMVLFAGVTTFKGRWMLPLLCMAPLAAFAARPQLQQHPRGGRYTAAILAVATFILAVAGVRPWLSGLRGQPDELNHPVAELADALRAAGYDGAGSIIAADHILAGTLRARFPHATVRPCTPAQGDIGACVAGHVQRAGKSGHGWLLVSRADGAAPGWWAKAQAGIAPQAIQSIHLPFHMMHEDTSPAHYEYVWHAPGSAYQP